MNEEAIYAALADLQQNVVWTQDGVERRFVNVVDKPNRRIVLFNEVPSESQPWVGQAEHASQEDQKSNLPYKTILEAQWVIYQADAQSPEFEATITNNLIIGAVREALKPKPYDPGFHDRRNTLNGLVYHCYIGGRTVRDPGDIDGQGLIIIPIKLLVP